MHAARSVRAAAVPAFTLLLWSAGALQAQAGRVLRGRVVAESDTVPVPDAIVKLLDHASGRFTQSSGAGRFELDVPAGALRLLVVRVGFAADTVAVAEDQPDVTVRLRESPFTLDPIAVSAERAYNAASSRAIRELDIRLRPHETAQELLRLAPGLVIAQHAGGGKAEQIFLRGFDADHGTDVAVSVDGVPVNMVSHGHGQGYADLHFITPEVVALGEVRKGPYDAQDGDLATAGAVSFSTRDRIDRPRVEARGGTFNTFHGVGLVPFGREAGQPGGYLTASAHFTDGPTIAPQGYRRFNGFGKFTAPVGPGAEFVSSFSAFDSRWEASGQIPERAVRDGTISRFGSIDPSEGGSTSRYDLNLGLRSSAGGERNWAVRAYGVKYGFELFSNFTFFLVDPVDGDGINQTDDRWMAGLNAWYGLPSRIGGIEARTTLGAGGRFDWTDVGLRRSIGRQRLGSLVDASVAEQHAFVWLKQDVRLATPVWLQLGIRGDVFRFDVLDRLERVASELRHVSGVRSEAILSPKLNLAVELSPSTTLFTNAGLGFHSNDARSVIQAGLDAMVLPRATGAELGGRHGWSGGGIAVAAWLLDLGSELVYVGDEGTTEPSGRTRRVGLDLEGRVRLTPWLWADADANVAPARFRDEPDGANRIPLAPTFTSTGGLTMRDLGRLAGGIRYRHIGARAADETGTVRARGYTVTEIFGEYRLPNVDFILAIDNVFDVEWNEAQFATTSRLRNEPSGVTGLHFTPGARRGIQAGAAYRF